MQLKRISELLSTLCTTVLHLVQQQLSRASISFVSPGLISEFDRQIVSTGNARPVRKLRASAVGIQSSVIN